MRVAAVQMRSKCSIAENCADFETFVRQAASDGGEYVQTPEMSGILQRSRSDLFKQIRPQDEDELVKLASALSAELGVWLHIGSHAIRLSESKAANRAFVFGPDGSLVSTYDKIHMFDVELGNGESWRESKVYQPGTRSRIVTVKDAKVGISICYDIRFPNLYREQALMGAQILTAPSSFTRHTGKAHWHILMRSRAIENGAFMISAAQGGKHDDGRETYGHSVIINPWGEIIAEKADKEPGVIFADINLEEVVKARSRIPNLANTKKIVFEDLPENTPESFEAAE